MKKYFTLILPLAAMLFVSNSMLAQKDKVETRLQHVMNNLKLDKATAAKFQPVCKAFLEEVQNAKSNHSKLKDKYKSMEKAGTLTNAQAEQLLTANLESDTKVLEIRKKYFVEFKKVLPLKKIYYAFDRANDKMSKITGTKGSKDEE